MSRYGKNVFFDFEFYEDGIVIEPISLGAVSSTGEEFYGINNGCPDWAYELNPWLAENVKPGLRSLQPHNGGILEFKTKFELGRAFSQFLGRAGEFNLIGYYADYDHVAYAQMYGTMMSLPKGYPMYTCDLKQWLDDVGNPTSPIPKVSEHNALADARWNKQTYEWLTANYLHPAWNTIR